MLVIPGIRLALLLWLGIVFVNWYEYILPVFLVFLFTQLAIIITRKACGKQTGKWRRMVGGLFIETIVFTFGIIGMIAYVVTGGATLFRIEMPDVIINALYLITLLVAWVILACLNEWMFK